jgi:HNH endonuclease
VTEDDKPSKKPGKSIAVREGLSQVVTRTQVEVGLPYNDYKPVLRKDFVYSCAYCTMTEAEAQGVRLVIDHYEPAVSNPELINVYKNLMYACDECNSRKGDASPHPIAREKGIRFFRIDEEPRGEHFRLEGIRLEGLTEAGKYTIERCDLNRGSLRRLRELRKRLYDYEGYASEGIMALVNFAIDRLPPEVRMQAINAVNKMLKTTDEVFDGFDALLMEFAKSTILGDGDTDEDVQRNKERLARLREAEGILPGNWRGRKNKKKRQQH